MHAPLHGLFVDDSDRLLTQEESLHIEACERLLKEFNNQFIRVSDPHKAQAIAAVAEKFHITQTVIGESQRSRWKILLQGSLT